MANQDTAFGLRPIGLNGAGANTTGTTTYEIAAANTNAIYQNSPVIPLTTGFIDIVGNANGGTVPFLGVLIGVEYVDSSTKKPVWKNYWPGANNVSVDTNYPVKAHVTDNPMQLYMVSADTSVRVLQSHLMMHRKHTLRVIHMRQLPSRFQSLKRLSKTICMIVWLLATLVHWLAQCHKPSKLRLRLS
jgi:hypothetical protein